MCRFPAVRTTEHLIEAVLTDGELVRRRGDKKNGINLRGPKHIYID